MKYLNGYYYVEVKDKRYLIHPTGKKYPEKEILQLLPEFNIKSKKILSEKKSKS